MGEYESVGGTELEKAGDAVRNDVEVAAPAPDFKGADRDEDIVAVSTMVRGRLARRAHLKPRYWTQHVETVMTHPSARNIEQRSI